MSVTVDASPRYGTANPERVNNVLWQLSIQHFWSGNRLRDHLGVELDMGGFRQQLDDQGVAHSGCRDARPGPFWSWQRSGRTSTSLLDGRIVHVAGSHEDFYDPDFCVYNDVVIEHSDGHAEILLYPQDVFPPSDFHSATLIGREIILIGSVGYRDLRRPGETQVFKLDTETLRIERVRTTGASPGWIAHHAAQQLSETMISISGGEVETSEGRKTNTASFTLDLETMTWQRGRNGMAPATLDHPDLEAVEIELALADEKYPIELDSLGLLNFFKRNAAGNWMCIRTIVIAGPDGEVHLVRPRQTFSRAMLLAGSDFYEHMQQMSSRTDRMLGKAFSD